MLSTDALLDLYEEWEDDPEPTADYLNRLGIGADDKTLLRAVKVRVPAGEGRLEGAGHAVVLTLLTVEHLPSATLRQWADRAEERETRDAMAAASTN